VRFVDTNIFLYAVSRDATERAKRDRALDILDDVTLGVSTQVLAEFYVQATRSTRPDPLTHSQAVRLVESFTRFRVQPITLAVVRSALATSERHGLSYWDSAIVEAARAMDCDTIVTEDLQDGQDVDGIVVHNPFTSR
jgi:predicted nucleic acid-binding protein